jgi:hypothetical protein
MDEAAYRETLGLLRSERVVVQESRYDAHAFGSWYIELEMDPAVRLLWDAKDRWVHVQTSTPRSPSPRDGDPWEDRWIGRNPEDQTPSQLVRHALAFARSRGPEAK